LKVHPVIFDVTTGRKSDRVDFPLESELCRSHEHLEKIIRANQRPPLNDTVCAEARSVVEGAKALTRPQKRVISNPESQPLAVALS
jgi:hypothetical protein